MFGFVSIGRAASVAAAVGVTAAVGATSLAANADARVVMGCARSSDGSLVHLKARPRDCGNTELGGTTDGIRAARWTHWGGPVASGRGELVDGLGFAFPARFWVFGRSHRYG
jgi:hypothetical protein